MLNLNRKYRPHGFFLWKGTQDGTASAPAAGDIIDTDIPGSAPTWSRTSAGVYVLTFPASSLDANYAVAFVQIQATSAAMYANVVISGGNVVTITFRDQAGAAVEANCTFVLLLFNYTAKIPA